LSSFLAFFGVQFELRSAIFQKNFKITSKKLKIVGSQEKAQKYLEIIGNDHYYYHCSLSDNLWAQKLRKVLKRSSSLLKIFFTGQNLNSSQHILQFSLKFPSECAERSSSLFSKEYLE
jgi:hypothetical protein